MTDPEATEATDTPDTVDASDTTSTSRAQLLWDVVVLQFKLAADGLRDLLLVPLSIASVIIGLIIGGDAPDQYFKRLLAFGRRTEIWINLFGYRKHAGTSDELIAPIKERVFAEARNNRWISKAGNEINKTLDSVNANISPKPPKKPDKTSS